MCRVMRFTLMVVETVLVMIVVAPAQMQSRKELLSVQDHRGQANVIRFDGRVFIEVQDLAAITKGSFRVEKDTVTLSPPGAAMMSLKKASLRSRSFPVTL